MKELLRYGFILSLICAVSSGLLASVNSLTQPKIISQAQIAERTTLVKLFPEAKNFAPIKSEQEILYYKIYSKDNKLIGLAFKAQAKGYSSTIETMVGMTTEGRISNIQILSHNETPGLGNRITELSFIDKFTNRSQEELGKVEAITGATISSKAVIDSVRIKAEGIKELIKNAK